jgi:hypothetical protein
MNRTFRAARATAVVAAGLAALGWAGQWYLLSVPAAVLALTAVLIALFTWFRKDDLSRNTPA